jgi:hypothetical protein
MQNEQTVAGQGNGTTVVLVAMTAPAADLAAGGHVDDTRETSEGAATLAVILPC